MNRISKSSHNCNLYRDSLVGLRIIKGFRSTENDVKPKLGDLPSLRTFIKQFANPPFSLESLKLLKLFQSFFNVKKAVKCICPKKYVKNFIFNLQLWNKSRMDY